MRIRRWIAGGLVAGALLGAWLVYLEWAMGVLDDEIGEYDYAPREEALRHRRPAW